jgi:hypothetical protein
MTTAQGYMSVKPTAVVEGNHEACGLCLQNVPEIPYSAGNFTQYKARFHSVSQRSNTGNNRYYSFERGLTHFIVFTAESYVYSVSAVFNENQLNFMKADLAAVDRKRTPWVVALVHKDYAMQQNAYADFSAVLEAGGVDVLFCGHVSAAAGLPLNVLNGPSPRPETDPRSSRPLALTKFPRRLYFHAKQVHYYNRLLPYNAVTGDIDSASVSADGNTYTNPKYMVTIVTGASGDIEGDDGCGKDERPSQTCSENYGWGIFTPTNATHATWDFHT